MASNRFSLTNVLLATLYLFAITKAAPIPKALDPEMDSALLPARDMWSEVAAVRPRYSSIDNLRVSPPAKSSRVVPKSTKWVEATFDPLETVQSRKFSKRTSIVPHFIDGAGTDADRTVGTPRLPRVHVRVVSGPDTPVSQDDDTVRRISRSLSTPVSETDTDSVLPPTRIGAALENRNSNDSYGAKGNSESRDGVSKELDVETEVGSRNVKVENSQFGPTEMYSGSLWSRSLKRDLLS